MSQTEPDHLNVDQLPDSDIVRILVNQHDEIRELCKAMAVAMSSDQKAVIFDELRGLIAVHEAAEEAVVRPRTLITAGQDVVDRSNAEERALTESLAELEASVLDSADFDEKFAAFAEAITDHIHAEEVDEFARLLKTSEPPERARLGAVFLKAERLVPDHAHPALAGSPAKQRMVAPFATLLDRAKDAFTRLTDH